MFPKTIKKIGNQAFIDTGIKKLELPDSVIEIGRGAFERQMVSKRIKKIRLQKNLEILVLLLSPGMILPVLQYHKMLNS